MTTVAEFDFDRALDRLLDAAAEIVEGLENVRIAVLTVETNDHRQARRLLREMVATLTEREFTSSVHKDWIRAAQQLVGPVEDPLPTAEEMRGSLRPEAPLPVIQRDDDDEALFPRRATDE